MGGNAGGGGNGGRSGGGGDAGQPGEVVREANKANAIPSNVSDRISEIKKIDSALEGNRQAERMITSGYGAGKITRDQAANAQDKLQATRDKLKARKEKISNSYTITIENGRRIARDNGKTKGGIDLGPR
jgi:diaminopimelate decarboxylase